MSQLRSIGGRAARLASGARLRARAAMHRRGYVPGLLSVVVPCYDVEAYLDECLTSLRFQRYRDIELIVVDDGSPDDSIGVARAHARRDLRVRVVQQQNAGLSAARNTGIGAARGEFLTFVDSDDVVQPDAFAAAIEALGASGSDFAVTNYDRLDRGKRLPAERWIRGAHVEPRLAVTVDEFPDAMVNAVAWSKTYRREFWDAAGLSFPVGKLYEDQPVSMAAYAQARTFDVLPEIGARGGSVTTGPRSPRRPRRSATWPPTTSLSPRRWTRCARPGSSVQPSCGPCRSSRTTCRSSCAGSSGPTASSGELLRQGIGNLVGSISRDLYVRRVNAQDKVLYELLAEDRLEDAKEFLTLFGNDARRFPSRAADDGVRLACRSARECLTPRPCSPTPSWS